MSCSSQTPAKTMYRGDNRTFRLTVTDLAGDAVDLTSCVLTFTVKLKATSAAASITKSSEIAGEIDIIDPTNGLAEINLVPDDTRSLATTLYVFDVQLVTDESKTYTLVSGTLTLKQDVTWPP